MKKYFTLKTVCFCAVGLFALYLVLTGLVAPWAGKRIAVNALTKVLGRQTRIESITFNPLTLETRVKNLSIESKIKGEDLASVRDIYINLSASSLLHLAPVISAVQVTSPEFALHLNEDNTLNISDLLEGKKEEPGPMPDQDKSGSLFEIKVSNIKISDATVVFTDHIRSVTHTVEQLNFDLPLVSTMEKDLATPVKAVMSCLADKARLNMDVTGIPFDVTRKMSFELNMQPLDLNIFSPYISLPAPYKIKSPGDLAVSVSGEYEIAAGKTGEDQRLAISLKTSLKNFHLTSVSGADLFACPALEIEASSQNVFDMNFLVDKVLLDKSSLFVERDAQGGINLVPESQKEKTEQSLGASSPAAEISAPAAQSVKDQGALGQNSKSVKPVIALSLPLTVKINQAAIKNMNIRFSDKMVSPQVLKEITSLDFILADSSIDSKIAGKYDLHILTGDNEEIKTSGNFRVQKDLAVSGRFAVDGIALKNFRPYLSPYLGDNFTLENVAAGLTFKVALTPKGLGVEVSDGQVTLDKFGLTEQGQNAPLVQFDQLALSGISCDLLKQEAGIGLVNLHKAQVKVNRDKKGRMDLFAAIEQALKTGENPGGKGSNNASVQPKQDAAEKEAGNEVTNTDEQNASVSAWVATIHKAVLDQCGVQFIDQVPKEQVTVAMKDIDATVENISTKKGEQSAFKVLMTSNDTGTINLDGSFDISRPAAVVNLDLKRIDVNTAEPYFTDFLNISISRGYVDTRGTVVVNPAKKKSDPPHITYNGLISLNNFLSKNKVDDTDFFSCRSLYASGMDISVNPMKVVVGQIALTDFYQRIILNKNAQLNYKQIMVEQPESQAETKGKTTSKTTVNKHGSEASDIRIDSITLQGGRINFSDYFTQPNFTANMTEIAGSLTGLSSRGKDRAKLVLKGVHGGYAPLDITGQLDPFNENRFIDLTVSFKNIELPKFNVYSKKYLGYEIKKGKLILDLHYNINKDKLNSSNRVQFDQLTLGQKVDSKDATSLPLDLAVSLLKNPNGQIDLDLPITGDMSDPKFHFSKVLGTALQNFIMGIVASPFKFLGKLVGVGSGQDLGYVDFDPGKSQLDQAQKDKLDKLILVLGKKPNLKLEILGRYNKLSDTEQLRYEAYETMVLSMDRKLAADGTVKLADLDGEKRTHLIEKSYKKATFPKPRDEFGKEKELTLNEQEKLLITSMPLDGDALSDLGRRRGYEIARYLTQTGKIDVRRVFVTEPDPVAEKDENSPRVKATFSLK